MENIDQGSPQPKVSNYKMRLLIFAVILPLLILLLGLIYLQNLQINANKNTLANQGLQKKFRRVNQLPASPQKVLGITASKNMKVAVIAMKFRDNSAQPETIAQMEITMASISSYFQEATFGKITYNFDVFGWYTAPMNAPQFPMDSCDTSNIAPLVQAGNALAAQNHIDLSHYQQVLYAVAGVSCTEKQQFKNVGINPAISFLASHGNGVLDYTDIRPFGKALGLGSANRLSCTDDTYSYTNYCSGGLEGDEPYDPMGFVNSSNILQSDGAGSFNAPHEIALGAMQPCQVQTITQSGVYAIAPLELQTTSVQALKIAKPDENTFYYLEYRRAIGLDNVLTLPDWNLHPYEGLLIHAWDGSMPAVTNLINSHLSTDFTLEEATFCDKLNNIHIQQVGRDATKAVVKITFEPCQSISVIRNPASTIPSITPALSCPIDSVIPTSSLASSPIGTKFISVVPSVIDKNNGKLRRGSNWLNWLLLLLLLLILLIIGAVLFLIVIIH